MSQEQDKKLYDTLTRTGELLKGVTPVEGEEYSLDAILAEFGQGGAKPARNGSRLAPESETETVSAAQESPGHRVAPEEKKAEEKPAEKKPEMPKKKPAERIAPADERPREEQIPEKTAGKREASPETRPAAVPTPPDRVSLKHLMADTVDAVLSQQEDEILEPRRGLSRRLREAVPRRHGGAAPRQDTEELWVQEEPEPEEELPPEPEPEEAYRNQRRRARHLRRGAIWLAVPVVLSVAVTVLEDLQLLPEVLTGDKVFGGLTGGLVLLSLLLGGDLWKYALAELRERRGCCEMGALLSAVVTLAYCVFGVFRGFGAGGPFTAVACTALWLCQLGLYLEAESRHTAYALINIGGAVPYTVSAIDVGTCKQKGTLREFYRTSEKPDMTRRVQSYIVPLLMAVATVLSGVVCIGGHTPERLLWTWAAMLSAALPLSLPLTGALPLYCLQKRLRTGGSAVAGWWGARGLQAKHRLILTENDLFPPGTVEFNGYKVFGEERGKMVAYAATMASAAKSQLADLFAQQLAVEGGFRYTAEDFQFYEDGGVGATIRGETVLMGSAYFMKQHHVALPHELKLQTGVFLAVDGALGAIFVIKYQPSRNVDWALRAMSRAGLRPVLAVRSSNVTPGLLKRKFSLDTHPVYPDVVTRLALSDAMETVGERANAVLYREGLMPLAETVIGSLRLRQASRRAVALGYLAAAAGLFLCYYFAHAGVWGVLSPLYMLGFALLWALPAVLLSGTVKRF